MKAVTLDMSDALKGLTIHVTLRGVRGFRLRVWLGVRLVRLAARVLRCHAVIEGQDA